MSRFSSVVQIPSRALLRVLTRERSGSSVTEIRISRTLLGDVELIEVLRTNQYAVEVDGVLLSRFDSSGSLLSVEKFDYGSLNTPTR